MLLLLLGSAWAAPSADALAAGWAAWQSALGTARYAPLLEPRDFPRLAQGGIVRHRQHLDDADRVYGAVWTDAPREALWIAIIDDQHDTLVGGLTERPLPASTATRKLLYQHIDLPWPVSDRQWVIEITNNRALWAATGGGLWERTWVLGDAQGAVDAGLTLQGDAVWLPVNDGGWLLADVAGGTLLAYNVRSVVGGNIPDEASVRWAYSTLDDMLEHVIDRAAVVPAHYGPAHDPILRPDDTPVSPLR